MSNDVVETNLDWDSTVKKVEELAKELDMNFSPAPCQECPVSFYSGTGAGIYPVYSPITGVAHARRVEVSFTRSKKLPIKINVNGNFGVKAREEAEQLLEQIKSKLKK